MKKGKKLLLTLLALVAMFATTVATGIFALAEDPAELFPDGGMETNYSWYSNGGTPVKETEVVHGGGVSVKASEWWSRMELRGADGEEWTDLFHTVAGGVTEGKLYKFSVYTKSPEASDANPYTIGTSLVVTGSDGNGGWAYPYVNMFNNGNMYHYSYNSDWNYKESVFGFVTGANGKLILYIDGNVSETQIVSVNNLCLDIGSTNGGTYFDDFSVKQTSLTKDVKITVKDGAEVVTGETLIVKDAEGNVLETQPEITENDGVYTVKGLNFPSLSYGYKYSVEGINGIADGIVTAINDKVDYSITSYDAVLTVKDEQGNAVADASVTASVAGAAAQLNNNNDGTYAAEGIFGAMEVTVSKEGYIPVTVNLSAESATKEVVLKTVKPATVINGNAVENGNFEATLAYGTQEPGKWYSSSGTAGVSAEYQQDGVYSLKINGTVAYRINMANVKMDGTTYRLSFAVAAAAAANMNVYMLPTMSTSAGWDYAYVYMATEAAVTTEFVEVSYTFSLDFNELEKTVLFNGNGVEQSKEGITGVAALDYVILGTTGEPIYIDNISIMEVYDASFEVKDGTTAITEGLTFEIKDSNGKELSLTPVYEDNAWKIKGVTGAIEVVVKQGEKTFPKAVFSANSKTAVIENGYELTLTLKDAYGDALAGATVVAKKGSVDLFTMVDNGDGTYTYQEALGTFNLQITIEGHTFEVIRNVSSENAQLSAQATYSPEKPSDSDVNGGESEGGCFGGMTASLGFAVVLLGGAVFCARKKRA